MQRQGSDVVCAYDYTGLEDKDRECTPLIGNGLVEKTPLKQAIKELVDEEAIWVFDANDFPKEADYLRSRGESVIGTSQIAQRLEDDRQFAVELAQQVGFAIPESEEFTDYARGLQFLEANQDRAWCYKPDAQDPTSTYVPMEKDDPSKANLELREYMESLKNGQQPKFMLQEVVNGVEANFEMWVSRGQPLIAFCDLEAKRKLVGDLGENVGCAGDFVFRVPLDTPGVIQTVSKYLSHPRLRSYTGSIDANVMIVDGQPYFLENCFRFGYNAYPTIFQELAQMPMEDILRGWVDGKDLTASFREGVGSSLSVVVDHPKRETPLIVPESEAEHLYLYRSYYDDGLKIVEGWSEIACVTGLAANLHEAGQVCLERMRQIGVPDKGYRTDLISEDLPTLPIARYLKLVEMGWIPEQDELMAAAKAFLATVEVG